MQSPADLQKHTTLYIVRKEKHEHKNPLNTEQYATNSVKYTTIYNRK